MLTQKLSIIIVNYATPELCNDCLDSVLTIHPRSIDKTFVVDNKSHDNSIELISNFIRDNNLADLVNLIFDMARLLYYIRIKEYIEKPY